MYSTVVPNDWAIFLFKIINGFYNPQEKTQLIFTLSQIIWPYVRNEIKKIFLKRWMKLYCLTVPGHMVGYKKIFNIYKIDKIGFSCFKDCKIGQY